MYRILIVEDDLTIASALAAHLRKWDYEADYVEDFKNVMERFGAVDPQLVILDIGLPFFNGFYWCQQIRQVSQVPIIFLSSLDDNMNIVMAMNMGGDEFIEKPFDLNVVTLGKPLSFLSEIIFFRNIIQSYRISRSSFEFE